MKNAENFVIVSKKDLLALQKSTNSVIEQSLAITAQLVQLLGALPADAPKKERKTRTKKEAAPLTDSVETTTAVEPLRMASKIKKLTTRGAPARDSFNGAALPSMPAA